MTTVVDLKTKFLKEICESWSLREERGGRHGEQESAS